MRWRFLGFAMCLAAACNAAPTFPRDTAMIVSAEALNQDPSPCGKLQGPFNGGWPPNDRDVQMLESRLAPFLAVRLEQDARLFEIDPLSAQDFVRKYAGVTVEDRRLIAICGAHRSLWEREGSNWRTHPILIRDGGSSHFGALYDPATGNFDRFEFGFVG